MLELQGLEAGYGEHVVLRGISMVVPDASVVALLGPNGAGKTTLLRAASGLIRPKAGRLLLDGDDVTGSSPHYLASRGVCHVPEGRGVFPTLTVRQNLVVQSARGGEEEAIERSAAAFPVLGSRLAQLAGTLSGGEQQMLALTRSFVRDPAVVLLDEVSMGLAPRIVDEIFLFLEDISRRGAALLLVEQYVTRALELADYVFLLAGGDVAFAGEPAELDDEEVFRRYVGAEVGTTP